MRATVRSFRSRHLVVEGKSRADHCKEGWQRSTPATPAVARPRPWSSELLCCHGAQKGSNISEPFQAQPAVERSMHAEIKQQLGRRQVGMLSEQDLQSAHEPPPGRRWRAEMDPEKTPIRSMTMPRDAGTKNRFDAPCTNAAALGQPCGWLESHVAFAARMSEAVNTSFSATSKSMSPASRRLGSSKAVIANGMFENAVLDLPVTKQAIQQQEMSKTPQTGFFVCCCAGAESSGWLVWHIAGRKTFQVAGEGGTTMMVNDFQQIRPTDWLPGERLIRSASTFSCGQRRQASTSSNSGERLYRPIHACLSMLESHASGKSCSGFLKKVIDRS